MGFVDLSVYITIAICYNLVIHQLTTIIYKDLPYDEKYNKGLTFIFIAGILGIVVSRLIIKNNANKRDQVISTGLALGGLLLILTSIFVNWNEMTEDIKLYLTAGTFCILIWYLYNYYDKDDLDHKKHNKLETFDNRNSTDNADNTDNIEEIQFELNDDDFVNMES